MTNTPAAPEGLGALERRLSPSVGAAVAAGIVLGNLAPRLFAALAEIEFASVNLPVAGLVWAMV